MRKFKFEKRKHWQRWVTPKPLIVMPIHRWYFFPHSYTGELVYALIDEWKLGNDDRILDPFAGAGTTLLAAKERGIPASGYDISPLAVLAAQVKISDYNPVELKRACSLLIRRLNPASWNGAGREYPELVRKALPGKLLGAFDAINQTISTLNVGERERDFLKLALLATIPEYSHAVATGGWLKWMDRRRKVSSIPSSLSDRLDLMLTDVLSARAEPRIEWRMAQADARVLPENNNTFSAVITSPPYPNRHDYTRVFGVELMFAFLNWEDTRHLRYQSFHSHPEAKPDRPAIVGYRQPIPLTKTMVEIRKRAKDRRVHAMIEGYFLDMFLSLREIKRVCRKNARIALVVGNAQYCGQPIAVDELSAEIGEQIGLDCEIILVARYRGNSAQQMGEYGRNPSRESVVIFRAH